MKEEIKELRVKIDGLAQLTKALKPLETVDLSDFDKGIYSDIKENKHIKIRDNQLIDVIKINSKELEKAVDSLYLAKAWLGKVLGELGNENPYGSGYKTVGDIVPTQDVATDFDVKETLYKSFVKDGEVKTSWSELNHIEKVDWLRQEIESCVKKFSEIALGLPSGVPMSLHFNNVVTHLCEARFWLGFELERIKTENAPDK